MIFPMQQHYFRSLTKLNAGKNIFLIGLAGAGKSTLGRKVADKLGYSFIDLDQRIEEKQRISIPKLFQQQGEAQFRRTEHEILLEIVAREEGFVMATGGGTPCYYFNIALMNDHGVTVYLDVSPDELALRIIETGIENRPIFKSHTHRELVQEIREIKTKREVFYQQAHLKIEHENISANLIVSRLKEL